MLHPAGRSDQTDLLEGRFGIVVDARAGAPGVVGGKVFMTDQGRVAPDHPQHGLLIEARSPRLPVLPDRPKDPALGDLGRRQPFINSP